MATSKAVSLADMKQANAGLALQLREAQEEIKRLKFINVQFAEQIQADKESIRVAQMERNEAQERSVERSSSEIKLESIKVMEAIFALNDAMEEWGGLTIRDLEDVIRMAVEEGEGMMAVRLFMVSTAACHIVDERSVEVTK